MAVASLFNVPENQGEFSNWAFAHMAHHRDTNRIIFESLGVALPEYVLDPVPLKDPMIWLYQHQTMHDNNDALLGVSGFDLTDVDFSNHEQFGAWVWLNASLHYQEAQITGIW